MRRLFIITILAFLAASPGAVSVCAQGRVETYLAAGKASPALSALNKANMFDESRVIEIEPERVPLAAFVPTSAASGTLVKKNDKAEIDYSNTKDGYVMVRYTASTDKEIRAIIKGPGGEPYTYHLDPGGKYEVFPLSVGNGSYQVGVYENVKDSKYSTVVSATFQVTLADEFAPFLRPNQYVNYSSGSETVKKAVEIVGDSSGVVAKISSIYGNVTGSITYDKELAKTVQSGYLPNADAVLKKGKGICFDYAAVATVMLRSQRIPTKLVIGYSGKAYHAWINVYSTETGWVDKEIYFDGKTWTLMDPTFAANKAAGNTANASYTAKLVY